MNVWPKASIPFGASSLLLIQEILFDYGTDVTPGEAPVAELLPKGNSREVGGARLGYAFDVLETLDRRTNSNEAPGERIICRGVPLR